MSMFGDSRNLTSLRRAVPFHDDMDTLFGKRRAEGELLLWFGSVLSGIVFCKLLYKENHVRSVSSVLYNCLLTYVEAILYDVSKGLSPVMFPSYNKLTKLQRVEWNNRSFSTAHALVSSGVAFYLLYISDIFVESAPYGPIMFRSTILSQLGLGFSCGYFIADISVVIAFFPVLGGYEFITHHLVSLISLVLAVHCGHAHLYLYIVLLSECTTPFINLRWYLTVSGLKNSKAYIYNGAFTAFLWLIVRVINFLYCFYSLYLHYDQAKLLHTPAFMLLLISPTSLGTMNFYWFYQIMRVVHRTLVPKRAP